MIYSTVLLSVALAAPGPDYKCVRWTWDTQNVFTSKVVCLEWKKKDCSNRLHKEICKAE
jgi:hypothetical protein